MWLHDQYSNISSNNDKIFQRIPLIFSSLILMYLTQSIPSVIISVAIVIMVMQIISGLKLWSRLV